MHLIVTCISLIKVMIKLKLRNDYTGIKVQYTVFVYIMEVKFELAENKNSKEP